MRKKKKNQAKPVGCYPRFTISHFVNFLTPLQAPTAPPSVSPPTPKSQGSKSIVWTVRLSLSLQAPGRFVLCSLLFVQGEKSRKSSVETFIQIDILFFNSFSFPHIFLQYSWCKKRMFRSQSVIDEPKLKRRFSWDFNFR